jgi:hypothetical protein
MIGNYLQKRNKAPSKVGLGFQIDRVPELKEKRKDFILMSKDLKHKRLFLSVGCR